MSEWTFTTLDELAERGQCEIKTGPFGTVLKAAEYTSDGVPVISTGEVIHGGFRITDKTPRVGDEVVSRLPQFLLREGDVVFARKGGVERNAHVSATQDGWFLGSDALRVRCGTELLGRFLAFHVASPPIRQWLLQQAGGSTMASLNQKILGRIAVPLPPLAEQERIAGVLGAFDDLIETNMTLASQLDRALFAHVRAAAQDAPTVSFGEVATRVTDKVASHEMQEGQTYLGLNHFGTDGVGLIGRGTTDGISSTSSAFRKGDVLYGKLRPYFRKVSRPGFDGVCSAEVWVLRAKGGHSQAVLHTIAHSQAFSDAAVAGSGGTRMPRADWKHLSSLQVPDLREVLGEREQAALDSLWQAACDLREETDEIAQQRDELLPLLMSGKVRVSELEGVT